MWPFTPKPQPPAPKAPRDQRGWVEDWKVGDIAICINDNWQPHPFGEHHNPCVGQRFTVSGLLEGLSFDGLRLFSTLQFREIPNSWVNCNFRKQRPMEAKARASWSKMLRNPQPVKEDA